MRLGARLRAKLGRLHKFRGLRRADVVSETWDASQVLRLVWWVVVISRLLFDRGRRIAVKIAVFTISPPSPHSQGATVGSIQFQVFPRFFPGYLENSQVFPTGSTRFKKIGFSQVSQVL